MITIPPRGGGGEEGERAEAEAEAEVGGEEGGPGPPFEIDEREGPEEGAAR